MVDDCASDKTVCMILMGGLLHDGRVRKESTSIHRHGFDVTVLTMPRSPENGACLRGITVEEIILRTRSLSAGRLGLAVKYVEFVFRVVTKAVRTRARFFHAHDLPTLLPAYLAARLRGGVLIYDAHELFTEQGTTYSDRGYWRHLERWLLRRVDGVLTTNESRAEIIHVEYGSKCRPVPIYNCPVVPDSLPDSMPLRDFVHQASPDFRRIVLFHGAISEGRQCEALVDSAQVLDDGTVIVFLGYGSPPSYIDALKARAVRQGTADKVLFHPAVPNDRVIEYIRSADVGVVFYENSCRNNYYCASNKLFDFLAVGVPVLGSDLPGITEITDGREVGITVNSEKPGEIGDAINRLVSDELGYMRMRENAISLSGSQFSWAHQEEVLLDFYRELLHSNVRMTT